jgi:signal transduction histidine kinase
MTDKVTRENKKLDRRHFLKYAGTTMIAAAVATVGYYYYWHRPKKIEELSRRDYVETLVNEAVNLIEEKGEVSFPEFRQKGSKWFHDDYYIWVWRTDGIRVVYPPDTSGEGDDMSDLEDYNGKPIGEMLIDIAKSEEGEGWIEYSWPKPADEGGFESEPSKKYAFVKKAEFGDQTYVVGSGSYVDS